MSEEPLLEHRVVSREEMNRWPVDRARNGDKCWAETTWGSGPKEGPRRLFYNYNTWPCRIVFEVPQGCELARGEAVWRRSKLSIRMKGLKLLPAGSDQEIKDAVLVRYDQERVIVDFHPMAGPGLYYLYYGAYESALFEPSEDFRQKAAAGRPAPAKPLRIEARCKIDDFDPMETIALAQETSQLLERHPGAPYLVFGEDRDRPIKLQFEIPADWALHGPEHPLVLQADRNEYRVFQLGIWACRQTVPDVAVKVSDLRSSGGLVIPSGAFQCLTLESGIQSQFITKPSGRLSVPQGQVRALWFGIDIPKGAGPGAYEGIVTVEAPGLPSRQVPLRLEVSETLAEERGDHEPWRLSRLRWLESDVGLTDEVFPPYKPLRVSRDGERISTWGHTYTLNRMGLPEQIQVGSTGVLSSPVALRGTFRGRRLNWRNKCLKVLGKTPGHVDWMGSSLDSGAGLELTARGRIEYDGCAVIDLELAASGPRTVLVKDLALEVPWERENADLATGMGYRGRREGDRSWGNIAAGHRSAYAAKPMVWMGSVKAGLCWATWIDQPQQDKTGEERDSSATRPTVPWENLHRPDAATITEEGGAVALRLNLGSHRIAGDKSWRMRFALLPTPVKPPDARHWDFRYMHKGGWFWPGDDDTPHSFLADGCKRLKEVVDYGVKRLNLHDWWGPVFNYALQWDRPDNLSRLTKEAHRRGVYVKVYNSGRELSSFAPEFWALAYEATNHALGDKVDPSPRLYFQDAWRQNHLPDGLPAGWPRLHEGLGNEHCMNASNATRNGNFYLESIRYMTRFYGTDGAYWDGADGLTLGHREMAKRLWSVFRQIKPQACIDAHHGHPVLSSPLVPFVFCLPFIDSLWHGEGFDYGKYDPWGWLVEIAALPFNVPSEMLGGEEYVGRGMLFGIWPRYGWGNDSDAPGKLWRFFDRFGIRQAGMLGWWEKHNGVTTDMAFTHVTAYRHPRNGVLLAIGTWQDPPVAWMESALEVTLCLDRKFLGLPKGKLAANDIITGQELDIEAPVPIPDAKFGRLIWVRRPSQAW